MRLVTGKAFDEWQRGAEMLGTKTDAKSYLVNKGLRGLSLLATSPVLGGWSVNISTHKFHKCLRRPPRQGVPNGSKGGGLVG